MNVTHDEGGRGEGGGGSRIDSMFICCLPESFQHSKSNYRCSWYLAAGLHASGGGPESGNPVKISAAMSLFQECAFEWVEESCQEQKERHPQLG